MQKVAGKSENVNYITNRVSVYLYVLGERYVYKFVCDPEALFNMAYGNNSENHVKSQMTNRSESLTGKSDPHHLAYSEMLNFYNCGISHPYQHLHTYLQEGKRYS